jgi:hypothetical protein
VVKGGLVNGYWILDTGCLILDTGCWMLDTGYLILDYGLWMLDAGYRKINGGKVKGIWWIEKEIL